MEILYLLIPLSALLVLGILGVFAWALHRGQFDDLEQHGEQILAAADFVDPDQGARAAITEKSTLLKSDHKKVYGGLDGG